MRLVASIFVRATQRDEWSSERDWLPPLEAAIGTIHLQTLVSGRRVTSNTVEDVLKLVGLLPEPEARAIESSQTLLDEVTRPALGTTIT